MRRALLATVLAGAIAMVAALDASPPAPASAGLLPSPLPTLPVALPTLPPVQVGPVSTAPVNRAVSGVTSAVQTPAPVDNVPLHPSQSGQPASAAPSGGAGAGSGSGGTGGDPQAGAISQHQPSPEERSALPAEPQRFALEGQQAWLGDAAPGVNQQDGAQALGVGGGDGRFTWPIAFVGHPPITQRFGCTDVPGEPYSPDCVTHRFHTGIDLGVHTGTPVYATAAGVAHVYRSDSGYGNHVLLAHGNGWFTVYAHLSEPTVREGDVVRRGDPVGLSGSTGFSTGPHLHYEIRYGQQPVDPCVYLDC
jgi:murein DD-endopeptidase MepM/ murein hydrolase activator NlpD